MKKLAIGSAAVALIAVSSLCGWYAGQTKEHKRMIAMFEGTQATIVVHCGNISEHDLAAREKYFPVLDDDQRIHTAFEAADQMDGYVMILGDCKQTDQSIPSSEAWLLKPYPWL